MARPEAIRLIAKRKAAQASWRQGRRRGKGMRALAGMTGAPRGSSVAAMHIIEILLPLYDNAGERFGAEPFARVKEELVDHFGGLTAFTRSPAEGVWDEGGERSRDEIVVFEVMADWLDRGWWRTYRAQLEERFRQETIVVRAREVELL